MYATSNLLWRVSSFKSVKKSRGRPKKALRKIDEIRPNVPNPNPRKFLRSATVSFRVEQSQKNLLDDRAKAVGLSRSEYLRKLCFYSLRYFLSYGEYTLFVKRAKRMELSEYEYARMILVNYLKDSEPKK